MMSLLMKYNVNNIIVSILLTVLVPSLTVNAGTVGPGPGVEIVQSSMSIDKRFELMGFQEQINEVLEQRSRALLEGKDLKSSNFMFVSSEVDLERVAGVFVNDKGIDTIEMKSTDPGLSSYSSHNYDMELNAYLVSEAKTCKLIQVVVPAIENDWTTFGDESRPEGTKDGLKCIDNSILNNDSSPLVWSEELLNDLINRH